MNTEQPQQTNKPLGVLFGVLAYETVDEYETHLQRLKDKFPQDIWVTVESALRYAQAKGVLSLEESEVISIILRSIKN